MVGVSVPQFEAILAKVVPLWEQKVIVSYKRPGRHYKLEVTDMTLMVLLYYRSYITHDFRLHKEEPPIPQDTGAFVDSGYQGLDKLHTQTELPYKATKTKPPDEEEKEYNRALSRLRVVVEHGIGDMKVFKILCERYRNKCKHYGAKLKIIAGIINLKNGFGFA